MLTLRVRCPPGRVLEGDASAPSRRFCCRWEGHGRDALAEAQWDRFTCPHALRPGSLGDLAGC